MGVDALIVQDLGLMQALRQLLPGLRLHASTQMTVHNSQGIKFLEQQGIKRVVLARELSLKQIQEIKEASNELEIEVFVHGALCFSYSGQCLFSSMVGGRSGNRGRCAQPAACPMT
jgi:putative protease